MHNTGNPIGSRDILDLYDNSENVDHFVNSQLDETPDRFGVKRLTLSGLIKRSMALRNEINDFSGAMTFKPEWTDVPMNVSEGVGGEGGALNLQAEALGNRSEVLKSGIRDVITRVYQNVGLNLVSGSFEAGGVLNGIKDILLEEKTLSVFSSNGPFPVVIDKNTSPNTTGLINRTKSLPSANVLEYDVLGDNKISSAPANTAGVQQAMDSGAAEIYFPDGTYYLNDTIILPESVKKITLSQNAVVIQTVDKPIYYKAGSFIGGSIPILGSPLKGSSMMTLNPGTYDHLSVNDWIFIRGANKTPNVTAGSACACIRKITSITELTNIIHIDAPFYRDMGSGSLTRMYKIRLGGKVLITGGTYTSSLNQQNFKALFDFLLCESPDFINVCYKDLGAAGLALTHCIGGHWINCRVSNLLDDKPTNHFGYGVALRGACRGFNFTSGVVDKVRHAITTGTASGYIGDFASHLPLPDGHSDLQTTGEPESCVYGPSVWVYNSTNAAFDCHEQGYGITITPNANGCFEGVLLRCSDVAVIGGQIHNCRRAGIRSEFPASNSLETVTNNHRIHGTSITNISMEGTQSIGILLEASGTIADVSDVSIIGYSDKGIQVNDGVILNLSDSVVDAGSLGGDTTGIYFSGLGSEINNVKIKSNKYGIRSLPGRNKYRHVTFINNTEDVSPSTSRDSLNDHPIYLDAFIPGRYYTGTFGVTTTSNIFGNGQFRVHPFTVREKITLDRIGAEIVAGGSAGALLRLGIYKDNGFGYPEDLIIDAGVIDAATIGPKEIPINVTLEPGLYWLGGAVQGGPATLPTLRANTAGSQLVGATTLSSALVNSCVGYSNDFTGSLGTKFFGGSNANNVSPRIAVRVAL